MKNIKLLLPLLILLAVIFTGVPAYAAEPDSWVGNYKSSDGQTIEVISADKTGINVIYYGYSEEGWNSRKIALKFKGKSASAASYKYSDDGSTQTYTLSDKGIAVKTSCGSFDDGQYTKTDETFYPIDRFFDSYSKSASTQAEMNQTEYLRAEAWHAELKALVGELEKETSYKEDKTHLESYLAAAEAQAGALNSLIPMITAGADVKPASRSSMMGSMAPMTISAESAAIYRAAFNALSESIYTAPTDREWTFTESKYQSQMREIYGE
jgi:hypothetical protein